MELTKTLFNMKITELRIGNLIYEVDKFKGTDVVPVIGLVENDFNLLEHSGRIKPIPLTEEWLVKMGFEKKQYFTYDKGLISISMPSEDPLLWRKGRTYVNSWKILDAPLYVHQLQNLYFCLTGEELKINLVD